jgi:ribulose-5-phosphate 4-epimerase/fuculose-1-phosphate aldolase
MMDEGYIKYTALHQNSPIPQADFTARQLPELNEARTKCFTLGLVGVYPNGISYGNLSIRVNGDEFLISGTATGAKPVLSNEDYCLVKSFDIARNSIVSYGLIQASSESMTHGAVYRACRNVNCVIHIHSKKIFDGMLRDNYPFTPKTIAFGTPEIALAIRKCVKRTGSDEGKIVLAGHDEGIIAYGANIEMALHLILDLHNKYMGK